MPNAKFQGSRVLVRSDIVNRKIKSHRAPSKQFLEFREKLGLDLRYYKRIANCI